MIIQRRIPVMGNILTDAVSSLFTPRTGSIIEVPGAPAALSMSIVTVLAGAVVLMVVMKQKKVI